MHESKLFEETSLKRNYSLANSNFEFQSCLSHSNGSSWELYGSSSENSRTGNLLPIFESGSSSLESQKNGQSRLRRASIGNSNPELTAILAEQPYRNQNKKTRRFKNLFNLLNFIQWIATEQLAYKLKIRLGIFDSRCAFRFLALRLSA